MKKNLLQSAIVLVVIAGLLALAGCDTEVEPDPVLDDENGNWLARESNPFIGTWSYSNTTTSYELEFKTDSTIIQKVTTGGSTTKSTLYYLIKDNIIVISSTSTSGYTKYRFEVTDNNHITLLTNTTTYYTRVGQENPNANRILNLTNGLDGYWRRDNLSFGETEGAMFMYDWHTFRKNGTYHVYHYMNKTKYYYDRGEFSYYIDNSDRLVTLNGIHDVTVYYDFTKNSDDAFTWKTTSGGSAVGYERFDGETFWHSVP